MLGHQHNTKETRMHNVVVLTQEMAGKFKGGQVEVQNLVEHYLFRGEIAQITVDGNDVQIKFTWKARGVGFPPIPEKWVNDSELDYQINIAFSLVHDIGPSGECSDARLCINMQNLTGELIVIFPPNGSKLDPTRVEGLQLAPA